jgi:hypothetical protein
MAGICKICGCTDTNACVHPELGPCWWLTPDKDLCSHCVELSDDPDVVKLHPEKRKALLKLVNDNTHAVSNR